MKHGVVVIPALARGISVLDLLGSHTGSLSLENLAKKTNIPKASLSRILETLVDAGLIERGQDKRFYALARIIKRDKDHETFDRLLKKKLLFLAEQTGGTAEWYIPGDTGCLLMEQFAPPGCEVKLSAGPGFLRAWQGELDSVAALGYAFAPEKSGDWTEDLWFYNEVGESESLDKENFNRIILEGKKKKLTGDLNINTNGVVRMARPIFEKAEKLRGIVSLAFISGPRLKEQLRQGEELLIKNINSEEKNENTLL
jgi:DNA-binding transcriptional ArsR family regulator